jgi:hypothetical protein
MTRAFLHGCILLVFTYALSAACPATAAPPSDDIRKAAREGVNVLLKDSRMGGLHRLGFKSQAEIDNADLGEGFQICAIQPEKLLNESIPQDIQSLVTPTNEWQFLVVVGNKAYALLTVDLIDGIWKPVAIGSSELAKQLSDILQAWPASSGYQYRLVRVYQARSEFIELSQGGKVMGIIPLASLLAATPRERTDAFNPRGLRDPKTVLPDLRPVVKRNIDIHR